MVARSSPPDTPARPCGACTAARSGPSRCWSWSWTAGERCRGVRGWPPRRRCRTKGPAPPTPPLPGLVVGRCGRMGWDGGVRLALRAPFCPWGLSLGSPLLSLGAVSEGYPRARPRCPWELSLGSSPLSPGCLRVAAVGSSFPVSRLGSGDRRRLCLRCRSRGLNPLRGLSASQAAPLRCAAVGDRQSHKSGAVAAGWELTCVCRSRHRCVNTAFRERARNHMICVKAV